MATREQMREDFTDALAKVICDKKAMNATLAAAPDLPKAVVSYLRAELASNVDFNSPAQMKALVGNYDAAIPLQRLRFADSVTEADCLGALATMREKTGADMVDTPESRFLCKMFIGMGRVAVEAERRCSLPGADGLKPTMEKLVRQLHYVREQVKQGVDFCCGPAALANGLMADLMRLHVFADSCGLGGLAGAQPATGTERDLSPSLERRLEDYGISHGHLDLDDGRPFDITLRSAFQEAMLTGFEQNLADADRADMKEIPQIFEQTLLDCSRASSGLKLDDTVVARANESFRPDQRETMVAKIEPLFAADKANGMRAARILSGFLHQGLPGMVLTSVQSSGEPIDRFPFPDLTHVTDYSVRRCADGSYDVHYSGTFLYQVLEKKDKHIWLDPSRSKVNCEMDLKLSFDATSGKPNISFLRPPTMSGRLTSTGLEFFRDSDRLSNATDPADGKEFENIAQVSGALNDPEVMQALFEVEATEANKEIAGRLLRSRFLNQEDLNLLNILGFDAVCVKQMASGMAGDDSVPKLGKETIARLKDPSTRDSALRDLATMAAPIVGKGWEERLDVRSEMLSLVTVAGLSTSSYNGLCDAQRVADFIKNSEDPAVKKLPADLQSSDAGVVSAAKARVQQINRDLRLGAGLNILRSHLPSANDTNLDLLRKYIPDSQYQHLLKHVAEQDDFFDDALRNFRDLITCAEIINVGKNSQPQN